MQNSQLLITLRTLTPAEWRDFQKYVNSPFFNRRTDVFALSEHLRKDLAKPASDQGFGKEAVWKKIHPQLPYDEKQLRYTMSYLLELAEGFLVQLEIQSDAAAHKLLLFNALRKRSLEKNAESPLVNLSATASSLADAPALSRSLQKHRRERKLRQTADPSTTLLENADDFTLEMLTETLREGCAFLEIQRSLPVVPAFPWLQTALEFSEKSGWLERSPTLRMLHQTYRMLEKTMGGAGTEHFFALKQMLGLKTGVPGLLQRESWLRAINFAIRQQNLGNKDFGKEAFDLYQSGIANGLIFENGLISKKAYSNTLVLALLVGEWDWAEAFLKDYQKYLPENERENTYRHNLATLFFKQKQFGKVLETLQNVAFTDSMHNLDDRRLLLCSYYELGEWAALESLLDSFGIWLRRAKGLGYHRELYANLVKYTRRLVDARHLPAAAKEKLKLAILAAKNVAAKEWLVEKVTG